MMRTAVKLLVFILACANAKNLMHYGPWKSSEEKQDSVDWWQRTVLYQIYPRSFMDSDGDGVGDLAGIAANLDHFVDLGVETIWLSPIYKSPMTDFGYDISDFKDVDPIFGTLEDFDLLVAEVKSRGLRIVLDFVPNHSSDEHEWFARSVAREEPYSDYYIWQDPLGFDEDGNPIPPSNWLSVFRYSAWEWNEEREQFYLHQFLKKQPDLNFFNDDLVAEFDNIIRFWLDRGVDGFRCDAVKHMAEVQDFNMDEPLANNPDVTDPTDYNYLDHIYTTNQDRTYEVLRRWRVLLDEYSATTGETKVMITEVYEGNSELLMAYYGTEEEPIAHFTFNFKFIDYLKGTLDGNEVRDAVANWLDNMPAWGWANWVIGNHDNSRVASRFGEEYIDAVAMLVQLLPGTAVTYYGEEIGMEDTFISWEQTQDPFGCNFGPEGYMNVSRDPERTPMQWNDGSNAGFSSTAGETWLPVNENYETLNVAVQQPDPISHLSVYKSLVALRQLDVIRTGDLIFPEELNDDAVVTFIRTAEGSTVGYAVVVNFFDVAIDGLDLTQSGIIPDECTVVTRSGSAASPITEPGNIIDCTAVPVGPKEGVVLEFVL